MAMRAVAPQPSSGPKCLRIGLIKSGNIEEERIIRSRETVTIGGDSGCFFVIEPPSPKFAKSFKLFEIVGDEYRLNFTDEMKGRVGLASGVKSFEELRSGGARKTSNGYQVPLSPTSRGKVSLGKATFLFQFIDLPPAPPKPQLPAAAQGGFARNIDWLYTACVVFTYMFFCAFIVYLDHRDWPIEQRTTILPDIATRLIFQEPVEPEEPEEEVAETEEESDESDEPEQETRPQPRQQDRAEAPRQTATERAEQRQAIAQTAVRQAEQLIQGALGEGGALANLLADGAITNDAQEILSQTSGTTEARGAAGRLNARTGGTGSGLTGRLGQLREGQNVAAANEGSPVQEQRVRGRVNFQGGGETGGAGVFSQAQVSSRIRARRRAFQGCYERSLRNNPALRGKVTVQFTIQTTGTVSGARAAENTSGDAGLASCVVGVVRRLRWNPGPEGGSVQYRYPFVFQPQN